MTQSLESAALDIGIDAREIDLCCIGVWQRLPTLAKPRKNNGAVMLNADGSAYLCNWETREEAFWRPGSTKCERSEEERRRRAAQIRANAEIRERHQRQKWADAAEFAGRIWHRAKPASADHPYLARKKLPPFDLRETRSINDWPGRWLIAPAYDRDMRCRNLECISEDGTKRPIRGAQRNGLFGLVGPGMPTFHVIIAEGWATGAALAVALSQCVVVAYGAHNLMPTALLWRSILPSAHITIAADNDVSEVGQCAAIAAAEAVTIATVKMPTHPGDWCDVYVKYGADTVQRAWLRG
jgi:putative DNA primase/helicase